MAHHVKGAPHHDDSSSSSSASSSASASQFRYGAFISLLDYNYCGRDANTFATKLSSCLRSRNLQVFLDKPDFLFEGKIPSEIKDAILSASVHFVIITPNYAQSKWCLDVLVLMIKSRTTIFPVFYYVKPSDFRWTGTNNNGSCAKALCNYEKQNIYDPHTIKKWRDFLRHISEISGFVVDENHMDEEGILIKVIESVFRYFPYGPRYDLFLNHRGPDVKQPFAMPLYNTLVSIGFRVFLDEPEMERGFKITPQIELAIQLAHLNIAIFSPTYARSEWCLDELALMVRSGITILPVLFNVRRSDLKILDDGMYAKDLLDHQKKGRCDSRRLQVWRNALSEVQKLPCLELDGNREELLAKIVIRVKEFFAKRSVRSSEEESVLKSVFKEDVPKKISTERKLDELIKLCSELR